jgi:photosystem II stability/assembly factor-like uncharacterized protein
LPSIFEGEKAMKILRISLVVCYVLFCGMQKVWGQWVKLTGTPGGYDVLAIASDSTNVFAGIGGGFFVSTDNGKSWNASVTYTNVTSFVFMDTSIIAGTLGDGVFLSNDHGINWTGINSDLQNKEVLCLVVNGTNLFAGTQGGGAYLSTNAGKNWTTVSSGLPNQARVLSITVSGTNIFAGMWEDGVYRSTNNGKNWIQKNSGLAGVMDQKVNAFAVSGTDLFAGTNDGVFLSTNNGTSWSQTSVGIPYSFSLYSLVYCFAVSGKNIFAGTSDGVYLSTNNGTSWTSVNSGLQNLDVTALCIAGTSLYAGTGTYHGWKGEIWRRPLSDMITDITDHHNEISSAISLHQNYPNPFSPSTTISFTIPSRSFVSLKIFDALGKEVSTLVSGDLDIGEHSYQWNASGLRSGVYLCRLQAGSFTATRKLSLLR